MNELPLPANTRAMVVGIEDYSSIDVAYNLPGAAADALRVANWLQRRGVSANRIDIRLAPLPEFDDHQQLEALNLSECSYKRFSEQEFYTWVDIELRNAEESMLVVYWSGHGLNYDQDGNLYLLLPNASDGQLVSVNIDKLQIMLQGRNYAVLKRQLFILDACRSWLSTWAKGRKPSARDLDIGPRSAAELVEQYTIFACKQGQAARLEESQGSRFTATLLEALGETTGWPDFDAVFQQTRNRVRDETDGDQSPVFWRVQNWEGERLKGKGFMGPGLNEMLSGLGWTTEQFRKHFFRSIPPGTRPCSAPDLSTMLDHLADLPYRQNVQPLVEFILRIADKTSDPGLNNWLNTRADANQRAEVKERLEAEKQATQYYHLILWYWDASDGDVMQGVLTTHDGTLVDTGWAGPPRRAIPVCQNTVADVIGSWLDLAVAQVGNTEIIVELCLPRAMFSGDYDLAEAPVEDGVEIARLGFDYTVLLHCTERYKGRTKLKRWEDLAPQVLKRLGVTARPLRWAKPGDRLEIIEQEFCGMPATSPVWLASTNTPSLLRDNADAVDIAIDCGLPALCWPRRKLLDVELAEVEADLSDLLQSLASDMPAMVRHWRRAHGMSETGHLALFWDDPKRPPPMVRQMRQGEK